MSTRKEVPVQPLRKIDLEQDELVTGPRNSHEREVLVRSDDGAHARDLQNRLVEAYSPEEEQKLPIRQRAAIIVGSTTALWLLIGGAIYLSI